MSPDLKFQDLIDYTEWERAKWSEWLRQRGIQVLQLSAGPHGDGRFQTLGDLVRHIFSAEMRYIDRLSNRDLTDPASVPNHSIEALFQFGEQSRRDLKQYVTTLPANHWDVPAEYKILNSVITRLQIKLLCMYCCMRSGIGRRLPLCFA